MEPAWRLRGGGVEAVWRLSASALWRRGGCVALNAAALGKALLRRGGTGSMGPEWGRHGGSMGPTLWRRQHGAGVTAAL